LLRAAQNGLDRTSVFVLEDHGQGCSPVIHAPSIEYPHLVGRVSPDRLLQAHRGGWRVGSDVPEPAELPLQGQEARGAREPFQVACWEQMSPKSPCARIDVAQVPRHR
jgi:hypothetical protein